ncbi:MAG: hypothetical protein QOI64_2510 [Solirubrobacteraceae bacterium]|nr:hypothetical protein [Solirubrobacteraceae bacterium]
MVAMTAQQRATAQRLLDAQVEFLVAQLSGEGLAAQLEAEIDRALQSIGTLTLEEAVTRDQIKAVARKYATTMQIHGSIPELMGEIAERLYSHPAHDRTRIGDVVAQRQVAAVAGKLLSMETLRSLLLERLVANPLAVTWLSSTLDRIMAELRDRVDQVPGLMGLLSTSWQALGNVAPGAQIDVDLRLHEVGERIAHMLLRQAEQANATASDQAPLFDAVMDVYHDLAEQPVSLFRQVLTREDLEDLLVIGYELWLHQRDTDYLRSLIDEGVDFFFDKYGDFALRDLLEEVGVRREDLVEEGLRFGPPVTALLRDNGMLAAMFRRRLEPFFFSEAVLALL